MALPAARRAASEDGAGTLMTAAELKPLLHIAKQNPVCCAIAMTKDKQGIILLHKKTRPKKLLTELKAQARAQGLTLDTTSLRFGHVSVDGASDAGMATFTVNKKTPDAMRRAMLEQVRPAGLQRCEIVVDEGLEDEAENDAPGAAAPVSPAPTQHATAAKDAGTPTGSDAPSQDSPGSPVGSTPAGPATNAAPAFDAPAAASPAPGASAPSWQDRLRPVLADLARQVAAATQHGTPRREQLSALADQANAAIKAGDRDGAVAGVRRLHEALAIAPDATGPGDAATAIRAGFDARADTSRDRSEDVQVAGNAPRNTAMDAGSPGAAPAAAPSTPPSDDTSWVGADGWNYRPVPPGTPPVVTDVPRALGEFDDAHGRVLTRGVGLMQAAGGAGEGLVAGGLMAVPEPTMLTKVAGAAMGVNAADNMWTGLRTAWDGQARRTLTAQAAGAGAHALGASPERAERVAGGVNLGQGLAGFGATTITGIARGGMGMAAKAVPTPEGWPQTVTVGVGRVDMAGTAPGQVAQRITFAPELNEGQTLFGRRAGEIVAGDPVASAHYARLQRQGTQVTFSNDPARPELGYFDPNRNRVDVNLVRTASPRQIASVVVHEATHQSRSFRGANLNQLYEEYLAFRNEELFRLGRRPTLAERMQIWEDVKKLYPELPAERQPFGGGP